MDVVVDGVCVAGVVVVVVGPVDNNVGNDDCSTGGGGCGERLMGASMIYNQPTNQTLITLITHTHTALLCVCVYDYDCQTHWCAESV